MTISNNLFLSLSRIFDLRVTPDSLRAKMEQLSGTGTITNKIKTDMLIEIIIAISELDKKLSENDK